MIIELEGIDGVGKTTQCQHLKAWFEAHGHEAIVVKDLESTNFGAHIRQKLVSDMPRAVETELFAFLACKAQLVHTTIVEALSAGVHVICDRGIGSLISYFEAHSFIRAELDALVDIAVPDWYESTTVLIDMEPSLAMERKAEQGGDSKFDGMGKEFFECQREIFLNLAGHRDGWTILNGDQSISNLHSTIIGLPQLRALRTAS